MTETAEKLKNNFSGSTTLFVSAQGSEWGRPGGGRGLLSGYFDVSNRRYPSHSVSALVDVMRLETRINSGWNATYCDEVLRRASL
jgi:hypothetical protein